MIKVKIINTLRLTFISVNIILATSCSNRESDCTFSYSSNFTHATTTYNLTIKTEKESLIYKYSNKESELAYSIKYNKLTEAISIFENGLESKTILLGSKRFVSKKGEKKISCYLVNNPDLLGENHVIFFTKNIGIVVNKYSSATSDLIKIDRDSVQIQKLTSLLKSDSVFFNLDTEFFNRNLPDTIKIKQTKDK